MCVFFSVFVQLFCSRARARARRACVKCSMHGKRNLEYVARCRKRRWPRPTDKRDAINKAFIRGTVYLSVRCNAPVRTQWVVSCRIHVYFLFFFFCSSLTTGGIIVGKRARGHTHTHTDHMHGCRNETSPVLPGSTAPPITATRGTRERSASGNS